MRRTPLFLIVLCTLCAALLAPSTATARTGGPKACTGGDAVPTRATAPQARRAILCLVNGERRARGLRSLRSNMRLRKAAIRHSVHMARSKFFDHTSPAGTTMSARIKRSGYTRNTRGWAIGENIAWGIGALATPRQIVKAWMRSPGHRANILDRRYREIGIGIADAAPVGASASGAGATYTTDFGVRR